jgi:hypothetical protein
MDECGIAPTARCNSPAAPTSPTTSPTHALRQVKYVRTYIRMYYTGCIRPQRWGALAGRRGSLASAEALEQSLGSSRRVHCADGMALRAVAARCPACESRSPGHGRGEWSVCGILPPQIEVSTAPSIALLSTRIDHDATDMLGPASDETNQLRRTTYILHTYYIHNMYWRLVTRAAAT